MNCTATDPSPTPEQIADTAKAEQDYSTKAKQSHNWNSDEERSQVLRFLDQGQLKRLREMSLQKAGPIVLYRVQAATAGG